ncbi:SusC/RagA family TonB-linked outer membrane protein [Epilithonimonas xixisoli]|uniref:TonB-linked SusC/RagA family outer membrane protein n=1 Tax=Epilithonimonas xixisoli TaxID=1476462 RepID=A0A4R8IEH3_9FLAO|nr:TonB-dependent receptor [Epilithonimonas xixisoli]TDX86866.1 TonB-linked SusC/RagA family outer membrane protein [Epilithonimonas xixisoli]
MNKKIDSISKIAGRFLSFSSSRKFMVVLFATISSSIYSQQIIKGSVVSNSDGKPVSNATIKIANSKVLVESDADGNFEITASPDDVLVFTSSDFDSQEIKVGKKTLFNIKLRRNLNNIDEVVVIGYGKQKKSDITGAVSVVKMEDAKKTVTYDIAKQLQGQVAGVTMQSSGEPGGFVNMKIRGITSFTNNNPLFVVDGIMVNSPGDFAPGDVESIQVLKDASAAAIYGVRGAAGVVIITTKQGAKGKMSIGYKGLNGFQFAPKKLSLTNREQYQQITNQSYLNAGLPILSGNDPNSPYYINNVDTDWQEEGFTTGQIQNHSVNFNGGSENLSYSINLDYFKNTAYLNTPQDFERYALNANFSGKKGDKFKYGGKFSYTQSDKENFNGYNNGSVLVSLIQAIPTMPMYDSNRLGGFGGTDANTQAAISLNVLGYNRLIQNNTKRNRFLGDFWAEYEIVKGLKYKLDVSADRTTVHNRLFNPESDLGWYYITEAREAQLDVSDNSLQTTFINNLLTYDLKLGDHNFNFMAGWIQQRDDYYNHWSRGVGYAAGTIPQLEYATARDTGEYRNVVTTTSYIGRVNYNYNEKYLFTANFRQDKTSLFAPRNNHAENFSFSGGWRLDKEEFIKLPDYIKLLKLRGSWGRLGNNTIPVYSWENTINPFANYIFGGGLQPGSTMITIKDPNIKWETVESTSAALELNLFNKLDFTAEYYTKKSYDMLLSVPLPFSSGGTPNNIVTNAGDMKSMGWEFTLGYRQNIGDFRLAFNANLGIMDNEVLKLGENNSPIIGINSRTEVGRSAGELYGWIAEGIFQNTADVQGHATQTNAAPGDVKFKDLNGDGIIDDQDRTFLGRSMPKYTFGINLSATYKNFDLSMFWQGMAGHYIYNGTYSSLMIGDLTNHSTDMLNYWTPENTNTNIPRPVKNNPNDNNRPSNRFVEKGDYIKLQALEIGYTFETDKTIFNKVRIYTSGQNLLTFTKYKGYDPDFISDGLISRGFEFGSFPNPVTVSFGIEANF